MNTLEINKDAFSHGQIQSKLWLIQELEKSYRGRENPVIWVLGGWYALLPFLIFSRGILKPECIHSFDIDPNVNHIADKFNDAWNFPKLQFFSHLADVTNLDYSAYGAAPDIVINTSCEHFSDQWIQKVPQKTFIAAQSTDMVHVEHINGSKSLEEFSERIGHSMNVNFTGQMDFPYVGFHFSRYMLLGSKT